MSKINVPFALLSLATSVFLWASVYNAQNRKPEQKTFTASLSTRNLETTKYVITNSQDIVYVVIAGLPDEIRRVPQQNLSAIVDLTNPKVGDYSYPVIVFPATVRELMVSNVTARIKIDSLLTRKFEFTFAKTGSLPSGFHEDSLETSLKWVYVTGPSELVQKVSAVQLPLNLSSFTQSPFESEVEARAVDSSGKVISKLMLTPTSEALDYKDENINSALRVHLSYKFSPDVFPQNPPRL